MASSKKLEELREAARAAGLSASEEKFVCFDWSASQEWQEYLASLYPTPPLNKLLKWKKKFYKTHQVSLRRPRTALTAYALAGIAAPPTGGVAALSVCRWFLFSSVSA